MAPDAELIAKPPYPWFGGKSRIASAVWDRFGEVRNYVEPFFGGGACLLRRPLPFSGTETVNDLNGWLCNFWRAVAADPEAVAHHADWPVSELDLHARGDWLFYRPGVAKFIERLRSDTNYYDAQSAGWWVWGQCCWIGSGWGRRKLPHLGNAGQGVNRKLPHLGDAGRGVNRQLPHLGDAGQGLLDYILALSERMRRVRICCGDWTRVCGPTPTVKLGLTAVFLDPPYAVADRAALYGTEEDFSVAHDVRAWAIERGDDPRIRIALCGYDEHRMPKGWQKLNWRTSGGYASQGSRADVNRVRETIWFSPHCLKVRATKREATAA
jgi:DNA adenine methylase